ncbi:MAG: hypothetical protein AAB353_13635 [Candidatus Hydrogenedentota bacterium]
MKEHRVCRIFCVLVAFTICFPANGDRIKIPVMTPVYVQLDEKVTSKKKETKEGDVVRAHVWRDVRVDGKTVIAAGAQVFCRVSEVKKAKVAGRKGHVEIRAMSVPGVDGEDIALDGGYDKSGKGRMGAAIATFAIVAWPLIFIKGSNALLTEGTVFDCFVQAGSSVELPADAPQTISLGKAADLSVSVRYDDVEAQKKINKLPIEIVNCAGAVDAASIVTINGQEIKALPLAIDAASRKEQDGCVTVVGTVDFKVLSKQFTKGINRFEVEVGGKRKEVILEIEL